MIKIWIVDCRDDDYGAMTIMTIDCSLSPNLYRRGVVSFLLNRFCKHWSFSCYIFYFHFVLNFILRIWRFFSWRFLSWKLGFFFSPQKKTWKMILVISYLDLILMRQQNRACAVVYFFLRENCRQVEGHGFIYHFNGLHFSNHHYMVSPIFITNTW